MTSLNEVDLLTVQRRNHGSLTTGLFVEFLFYVCEETTLEIAQELGKIIMMDYHDATSTQIVYIRVRVRFGITHKLRFFQRIIFEYGETAIIRFQYERLKQICSMCFWFTQRLLSLSSVSSQHSKRKGSLPR
ncbi:hypothetical protein AtEden1_Chr4g0281701 [Arabidopsis thaliana]